MALTLPLFTNGALFSYVCSSACPTHRLGTYCHRDYEIQEAGFLKNQCDCRNIGNYAIMKDCNVRTAGKGRGLFFFLAQGREK